MSAFSGLRRIAPKPTLSSSIPLGTSPTAPSSIIAPPPSDYQASFTIPNFIQSYAPAPPVPFLASLEILTAAAATRRIPEVPLENQLIRPTTTIASLSSEPWVSENGVHGSGPFRSVPTTETTKKKRLRRKTKSEPLRCFHCGVTNTLHWRYGPNGKNTLCNACGLKYAKSVKQQAKAPSAEKLKVEWLLN